MHRIIPAILLAAVSICSLTACSSTGNTAQPSNTKVTPAISSTAVFEEMLDDAGMAKLANGKTFAAVNWGISSEEAKQAIDIGYKTIIPDFETKGMLFVDSLTDGLLMLRSGKVDILDVEVFSARYLAQRNPDLYVYNTEGWRTSTHVMFKLALKDQFIKVNDSIKSMNQDGTMQKLSEKWITNLPVGEEPSGGEIKTIAGAETLKIGISGDQPPLDYIAADGTPGGFNVAMLSEISRRAGINIKMVIVNSGSRFAALESGKIDSFLWQNAPITNMGVVVPLTETLKIGNTEYLVTESYLDTCDAALVLKK
jgi:ABC-type amino acid transport substrate-binding protein